MTKAINLIKLVLMKNMKEAARSSTCDDVVPERCLPARPRERTFTKANSSRDTKTKRRHIDIHISIALMYETLGSDALAPALCVVIVRTVSKPKDTLAGVASMFNQKLTQDNITIKILGMYT